MNTIHMLNIYGIGALAMGLWLYFFNVHRQFYVDQTRQKLFKVRDDLFDKAAQGLVPFDSIAYGMTRITINGMARFAHRLTLIRMLILLATHKYADDSHQIEAYSNKLQKSLSALDDDAQSAIWVARHSMHMIMLEHVICTSLLLYPLVLAYALGNKLDGFLAFIGKKTDTALKWVVGALDSEAEVVGNDDVFWDRHRSHAL